jgi:hypothetical protein
VFVASTRGGSKTRGTGEGAGRGGRGGRGGARGGRPRTDGRVAASTSDDGFESKPRQQRRDRPAGAGNVERSQRDKDGEPRREGKRQFDRRSGTAGGRGVGYVVVDLSIAHRAMLFKQSDESSIGSWPVPPSIFLCSL